MKIPQFIYGDNVELQRFFALLLQQMQTSLSDNGWCVPQLTTTEITNVTRGIAAPGLVPFEPVMPVGTIWYDTTLNKLKVLTTAAVIGASNGIVETITSA